MTKKEINFIKGMTRKIKIARFDCITREVTFDTNHSMFYIMELLMPEKGYIYGFINNTTYCVQKDNIYYFIKIGRSDLRDKYKYDCISMYGEMGLSAVDITEEDFFQIRAAIEN